MTRVGIFVALALTIAVAGCGGDSEGEPTTAAPEATSTADFQASTATQAPTTADPTAAASTATQAPTAADPTAASGAFDPATASDEEKKARYLELARAGGIEDRLLISEANVANQIVLIAEIQCQNTVADFVGFFQGMSNIEDDLDPVAANRAYLLDAFCPEARSVLEEAAASLDITVPPPE